MDVQTAAMRVFSKLECTSVPDMRYAVFLDGDQSLKMMKATTAQFARQMDKTPQDLVGVYDVFVELRHIVDDLKAVGFGS